MNHTLDRLELPAFVQAMTLSECSSKTWPIIRRTAHPNSSASESKVGHPGNQRGSSLPSLADAQMDVRIVSGH